MTILRRIIRPGALLHVIARFVNRKRLIQESCERQEYLERVGERILATDWRAVAYAVMSSHVHLVLVAGICTFDFLIRPAHSGFARWLNRRQDRLGPVFAHRPGTIDVDLADAPRVVAYVHNNPVRAGVVDSARDSSWTSHRAFIGLEPAPSWLDVSLGFQLCGLSPSSLDRETFDGLVRDHAHDNEPALCGQDLAVHRREARRQAGTVIELGYPQVSLRRQQSVYPVLADEGVPVKPRWTGDVREVLEVVSRRAGVTVSALQSVTRQREVTSARKLAVLVHRNYLGRPLKEIAAHLGITPAAATCLAARADDDQHAVARELAEELTVRSDHLRPYCALLPR